MKQPRVTLLQTQPLIELHNCSLCFADPNCDDDVSYALRAVDFALYPGQRWLLTGANGSGKSVLLKLLRGDLWPSDIGQPQRRYNLHGVTPSLVESKRYIAYLGLERQDKYLRYAWQLSVTQVVTTGLFDEDIPLSQANAAQRQQVARLLRRFKLWSLRERSILSLSYGQRRRVLLARVLAGRPQVLLLDEIFNGVDTLTRGLLQRWLNDTRRAPTWILASHAAEDVPTSATHWAVLDNGRLVSSGPISHQSLQTLRRDVALQSVAALPAATSLSPKRPFTDWVLRLRDVNLFRDYRTVLREVNWTVNAGEHWAIVGANGSGKSTLLMLLYGDLHPALGGVIERQGSPAGTPIAAWKARVGYVAPELQADYSGNDSLETVVASGRYASIGLNQSLTMADRRAARPLLQLFGIAQLSQRHPRQVSYGQMRLALLARALIRRPALLLLDEPFTGLDPQLQANARATLQALAEAGTQIIMAVHDVQDLPPAVTNVFVIQPNGRVVLRRESG